MSESLKLDPTAIIHEHFFATEEKADAALAFLRDRVGKCVSAVAYDSERNMFVFDTYEPAR